MEIKKTIGKIFDRIQKIEVPLFFISLFLLKLPPFYIFSRSQFFTNHVLSKIIIVFMLAAHLLRRNLSIKNNLGVFLAVFLYFISQSLSISNAQNIVFFWKKYQNAISGFFLFVLTYLMMKKGHFNKNIERFIYFTGIFMVIFELTLYLFPGLFIVFIKNFFQKEIADLYLFNFNEGKYNLYLSSELFLPFFVAEASRQIKNGHRIKAIPNLIFIYAIFFLSFISQFRTRILQLSLVVFLLVWQFLFRAKMSYKKPEEIKIPFFFLIIIFSLFILLFRNTGSNVVKRILLEDPEDRKTVLYRLTGLVQSYKLFSQAPVFGVGLGNYQYYVDNANTMIKANLESEHSRITLEDPHGIISETIAETGLFGLFCFLLMIFTLIKEDSKWLFGQKNDFIVGCIIASWTIMIRGLVSPLNTLYLIGWFWFLRGIISGDCRQISASPDQ